jgi:cytochrome c5
MKYATPFMIVASTVFLLACGKSEDTPAPATQTPVAEPTQAETPPAATVGPVAPVAETAQPEAAPALPATKPAQPARTSKPEAAVPAAASPASAAPATPVADLVHGQKIYRQACAFCHDRGVAGAPKTGDVAGWGPRLAQGMETLYTVAVRGKGAMPAKGGNPSLSETDVKAAVDYMVAQSR